MVVTIQSLDEGKMLTFSVSGPRLSRLQEGLKTYLADPMAFKNLK